MHRVGTDIGDTVDTSEPRIALAREPIQPIKSEHWEEMRKLLKTTFVDEVDKLLFHMKEAFRAKLVCLGAFEDEQWYKFAEIGTPHHNFSLHERVSFINCSFTTPGVIHIPKNELFKESFFTQSTMWAFTTRTIPELTLEVHTDESFGHPVQSVKEQVEERKRGLTSLYDHFHVLLNSRHPL